VYINNTTQLVVYLQSPIILQNLNAGTGNFHSHWCHSQSKVCHSYYEFAEFSTRSLLSLQHVN